MDETQTLRGTAGRASSAPGNQRLGPYVVHRTLGVGARYAVHEGHHASTGQRVALKTPRAALGAGARVGNAGRLRQLSHERALTARMDHPNIVKVAELGRAGPWPYMVMELLQGESLREHLLRCGRLCLRASLELMLPVIRGVAAAHARGVMHCDIKPANILLVTDSAGLKRPVLVDFGNAQLEGHQEDAAFPGPRLVGTPQYMAPEQALGTDARGPASDQYGLAIVLFECLAGRPPIDDPDPGTVLRRVARGDRPPLEFDLRGHDKHSLTVLRRATAIDPSGRYGTVAGFADALETSLRAHPSTTGGRATRQRRPGVPDMPGESHSQSEHQPRNTRTPGTATSGTTHP